MVLMAENPRAPLLLFCRSDPLAIVAWDSLVSAGFLLLPVYQPAYGRHPLVW